MQNIHSLLNVFNSFLGTPFLQVPNIHNPQQLFDLEAAKIQFDNLTTIEQCDELMYRIHSMEIKVLPAIINDLEALNKIESNIRTRPVFPEPNGKNETEKYINFYIEILFLVNCLRDSTQGLYNSYINQSIILHKLIEYKKKEIISNQNFLN